MGQRSFRHQTCPIFPYVFSRKLSITFLYSLFSNVTAIETDVFSTETTMASFTTTTRILSYFKFMLLRTIAILTLVGLQNLFCFFLFYHKQ